MSILNDNNDFIAASELFTVLAEQHKPECLVFIPLHNSDLGGVRGVMITAHPPTKPIAYQFPDWHEARHGLYRTIITQLDSEIQHLRADWARATSDLDITSRAITSVQSRRAGYVDKFGPKDATDTTEGEGGDNG
jgi:hypothetical protein